MSSPRESAFQGKYGLGTQKSPLSSGDGRSHTEEGQKELVEQRREETHKKKP
jgi:hypothetical protein